MTDIVVTVPKTELTHCEEEKFDVPWQSSFWNLSQKPKELETGDHAYFVAESEEFGYAVVVEITTGTETCAITNKDWKGCQVVFKDFEYIKAEGRRKLAGFRGFRYRREEHL